MKRIYIFLAVLVVALSIGAVRFFNRPKFSLYTVKRETLINTLQVTGMYAVSAQTSVSSPTNGIITKLIVANGDTVKKGDPLFYVESTATEAQKKAALANYLAAKATFDADNAQLFALQSTMFSKWKTYTDIAKNSTFQNSDGSAKSENRILTEFTTVQDDWLNAEANYKNQQSVIAKDLANIASTLELYNETQNVTVPAPVTGQVTNFLANIGDQVSAIPTTSTDGQTTTTSVPPVLLVVNFGSPSITVSVSEENIPKVTIGDSASIVFDAFPDKKFTGHVTGMDAVGTNKQGIISYNVRIDIDNVGVEVKPNMTANITIETVRRDNALTVPNEALINREGKVFVQKEGANSKHLTEVSVGIKGLMKTEVVQGVSEGEKLALPK